MRWKHITKKHIVKLVSINIALACLISTLFASVVYAENTGQVTLTVGQIIVNNSPYTLPRTTFTYRLVPKTTDAPMPDGSDLDGYTFTITGAVEKHIGPITFNIPGIFIYELSCATAEVLDFTIDRRIYTIEVYVTNDLQVVAIAYINEGNKVPNISFEHMYMTFFDRPVIGEPDRPATMIPGTNRPGYSSYGTPNAPGKLNSPEGSATPREPDIQGKPELPKDPAASWDSNDEPDTPIRPGPQGSSPRTGDFSNPTLWITLIIISCVLLAILSLAGIKSKERREH